MKMKRIFKFTLFTFALIFFSLFLSSNVHAVTSVSLSINGTTLNPESSASLNIIPSTGKNAVGFLEATVVSDDTSCVTITDGSIIKATFDPSGDGLTSEKLGSVKIKAVGNDCITKLKIKAKIISPSDGTGDFKNQVYESDVIEVRPYNNLNNYLKSLTISNATLSPSFDKRTLGYNISVPASITSLDINAVPDYSGAKVNITGNNLREGNNTINITVTSISGDERVYTVNAYKDMMGDVDRDGKISLTDVILALKEYFADTYDNLADMDYDNKISLTDVILVLKLYFAS